MPISSPRRYARKQLSETTEQERALKQRSREHDSQLDRDSLYKRGGRS